MSSFFQVSFYDNNAQDTLRRKETGLSDLSASCVSEQPQIDGGTLHYLKHVFPVF